MARSRQKKRRLVFVLGAGVSSECGAPLTREILSPAFTEHIVAPRHLTLVEDFKRNAYNPRSKPDIERLWTRLDEAILNGERVGSYDLSALRRVRRSLLETLGRVLSSAHSTFEESLEWCDLNFDWSPLEQSYVDEVRPYLRDPAGWLEREVEGLKDAGKFSVSLLQSLASARDVPTLVAALGSLLPRADPSQADALRELAHPMANVFFGPLPKRGIDDRRRWFCDKIWPLRNAAIAADGRDFWDRNRPSVRFLWRAYLAHNYRDRLKIVDGWLRTYWELVRSLTAGDAVITTNYDLFLECALLAAPQRQYGVLWGADVVEVRDEHRNTLVPGTAARYSIRERKHEGYVEGSWRRTKNEEEVERESREDFYEKSLKRWRALKDAHDWVAVLKLHGSLDWAMCSTCQELFTMRGVPFYDARQTILGMRRYIEAYKSYWLCCHNVRLEPLMVPPTWMKDYDNQVLVNVWREAEFRLTHADVVVFMGYSLPQTDKRIRELFRKAMFARGGRPWEAVVLVNRSADRVLGRFREVFGSVTPVSQMASKFLETSVSALRQSGKLAD